MVDGDQLAEAFGEVVQLDYCHGSQPSCPVRLPPGCQSPGLVCFAIGPWSRPTPGRPAVVSVATAAFRLRPIGHSTRGARIGEQARVTVSRPTPWPRGRTARFRWAPASVVTPR